MASYINNSRKTVLVAEGITLCARFMDLSPLDKTDEAIAITKAWQDWLDTWPRYADFVIAKQYTLFDEVLRLS